MRVLEAFRPGIRDLDNIVADPETARAQQAAMQQAQLTPEFIRAVPQLVGVAAQMARDEEQARAQQAQASAGASTPS